VAVLVWPSTTLRTLGVLVGVWLLVAGLSRVLGAFLNERGVGRQVLSGMVGVVLVIGGAACLRNVAKGLAVLALVIALAWILSGLAEVVIGFQSTGTTRKWLIAIGVASIAIGCVFMLWPGLSLRTVVVLTGIAAVLIGASEIAFAIRLRRALTA
jgi:uncharacterized membrane protein HdeD (DUF308 family)